MSHFELFASEQIIGIFCGFHRNGLEFDAKIVVLYRKEFSQIALHGQFLLIQLGTNDEALLGRIIALRPCGPLSSNLGEDLHLQALRAGQDLPETCLQDKLKYRMTIHILGMLKNSQDDRLTFVPSHRRQPHHGSRVAFPSGALLRELAGHYLEGAVIGHFALGEFIYAEGSHATKREDWMHIIGPEVLVHFSMSNLIARRSLVFAKAGFGKSNFIKLCFSELYKYSPMVTKRANREVPVGT
ncbi:MAG TPA: hypothetical protein VFN35_06270, partial [Ktedonobacteraceae bacterium]|nr:hypothetical protein [Ktedonobacteraceae bacterium]